MIQHAVYNGCSPEECPVLVALRVPVRSGGGCVLAGGCMCVCVCAQRRAQHANSAYFQASWLSSSQCCVPSHAGMMCNSNIDVFIVSCAQSRIRHSFKFFALCNTSCSRGVGLLLYAPEVCSLSTLYIHSQMHAVRLHYSTHLRVKN